MPLYPNMFDSLEQERRAAARLALLEEQEYWRSVDRHLSIGQYTPSRIPDPHPGLRQEYASLPTVLPTRSSAYTPSTIPNRIGCTSNRIIPDPQLGLRQEEYANLPAVLPSKPFYAPYSAPLYSSPRLPQPTVGGSRDSHLYLKPLASALPSQSSTLQTQIEPSFSSPTTRPLSATTMAKREPPVPANQWEDSMMLPLAKRQSSAGRFTVAEDKGPNFPFKLMEAMMLYEKDHELNRPRSEPAFRWLKDQSGFVVLNKDNFRRHVLLQHGLCDKYSKYKSFLRKMKRWGFFRHSTNLGHCFRHTLFREGQFELCATIQLKSNTGERGGRGQI